MGCQASRTDAAPHVRGRRATRAGGRAQKEHVNGVVYCLVSWAVVSPCELCKVANAVVLPVFVSVTVIPLLM